MLDLELQKVACQTVPVDVGVCDFHFIELQRALKAYDLQAPASPAELQAQVNAGVQTELFHALVLLQNLAARIFFGGSGYKNCCPICAMASCDYATAAIAALVRHEPRH